MAYVVGFAVIAIFVWVMLLRSSGKASGEAIGNEYNEATAKIAATLKELVGEVGKPEPERLSEQQFHALVERAADDFTRYTKISYLVASKMDQSKGQAVRPLADFLVISTADFATAIGTSIEQRDATMLLQVMAKYGIGSGK